MEQSFKDFVQSLIGQYQPNTVETIQTVTDGAITTTTTSHVVIPDYSWLLAALIFTVAIYSIFRIVGSLLSGGVFKWSK